MTCEYFGICGSCTLFDLTYDEQKELKLEHTKSLFFDLNVQDILWFKSPTTHYRTRAEFSIWHDKDNMSYAMNRLDKDGVVKIKNCAKVSQKIYDLMPKLLNFIQNDTNLRFKLFGVELLSTRREILVTLLYHKKLDSIWDESAKKIQNEFNVKVIGRSKGIKRVISEDFLHERLHVKTKDIDYKFFDTGFVQPNTNVNEQMISFVIDEVLKTKRDDLLELYCGHGNFTIPLSFYFKKVFATEISKNSIKAASENILINEVENLTFARLSAEEFAEAFSAVREFKRLKNVDLQSYSFSHILVDPPRAGLDETCLKLAKTFKNIIYISCSQESLKRDLCELTKSHEIVNFALFDQFPYTLHVESGVILRQKVYK
ncbi:MAG: tRNA (uridine(54)-C5)-methyltransferase TrmA [Campylobacteraceae bacterium]